MARRTNRICGPASSELYLRIRRFCATPTSIVIAFLWGLFEATVFFIVPDVYLAFVALFDARRGLEAVLASVAGALLGGAILYGLAANDGAVMRQLLVHIPGISAQMLDAVTIQMQASGLSAMVSGPLKGFPFKIYAAQAGENHLPFIPFFLISIPARLERLLPVTIAAAILGVLFRKFVQHYTALVIGIYLLLWLGIYLFYFLLVV